VTSFFRSIDDATAFHSEKAVKADLFRGDRLFVGLNCFEPGQTQPPHTHAGADKLYLLVSGKARMRVGDETRTVEAGTVVWAPADVVHGVDEVIERATMLVAIAPPPTR
jgi:quercetin dioxygenase-like cupin family protein